MKRWRLGAHPADQRIGRVELAPPAPADANELGLRLRTARERLGLALEDVRDQIDVPLLDLDALERGHLAVLHTEQAAVVALWRYAERLGLDPRDLVEVLRACWPNRELAINAIASRRGFTPVAELRAALQLLNPIASATWLDAQPIGLSDATKAILESRSAKRLLALQLLAPVGALGRLQLSSMSDPELPQPDGTPDDDLRKQRREQSDSVAPNKSDLNA